MPKPAHVVEVDDREISISNPDKVFFPDAGLTKLDLVEYYLAVAPGVLAGCRERPSVMKRFPDGVPAGGIPPGAGGQRNPGAGSRRSWRVSAEQPFFFQKRVPENRPGWLRTATVTFPSGRTADLIVYADIAHVIWSVNLGCIDLNPWPVRAGDVDHPDELRIDLDPTPEASFGDVRTVALTVRDVLEDHGLRGFPKTSGSRGIHVNVRIEPRWDFTVVRRAALALGREVERRIPALATTRWWKEERHGVFIDYNQNARDRTVASAYSVRPVPDARVSCSLSWDEVADVEPADLTVRTVPDRFAAVGDPGADIDAHPGVLDRLLDLAARDEAGGLGDAPWPPHFAKMPGESRRVAPSRARRSPTADTDQAPASTSRRSKGTGGSS